jgi:putative transposase
MDQAARDAEVITALQAIVVEEQRWGFWKCRDRLRAQGYGWNHKRIWRVYCQLRLNLPRRAKRRVPQRVRQPLLVEPRMNAVWAIDFMRDTRSRPRASPLSCLRWLTFTPGQARFAATMAPS